MSAVIREGDGAHRAAEDTYSALDTSMPDQHTISGVGARQRVYRAKVVHAAVNCPLTRCIGAANAWRKLRNFASSPNKSLH